MRKTKRKLFRKRMWAVVAECERLRRALDEIASYATHPSGSIARIALSAAINKESSP
jgi:hypothetical protein